MFLLFFLKGFDNYEIQVQNFCLELFVKGEEINMFKVNFIWEGFLFKYSVVYFYIVFYEFFGGYLRDQILCLLFVKDNDGFGCFKSGVVC